MMPTTLVTKQPSSYTTIAKRPFPHLADLTQARRYVEQTGANWRLEELDCGIFLVTYNGGIVGKGLDYNTAIADAESNLGSLIHDFSLDLHAG
jgi:hypothetical protein